MSEKIIQDTQQRMDKSIESFKSELSKLRTGRAHPSMLEHIKVDYYDQPTSLGQIANVSVEDSRTLAITPWEKTMVSKIEKAIMTSDLGIHPTTAGVVIRVNLPPLTEERRKDLVKVVRDIAEQSRVAVRNIRREANNQIKDLLKDKEISEDDERREQARIQKQTDQTIELIDQIAQQKEQDLMAF